MSLKIFTVRVKLEAIIKWLDEKELRGFLEVFGSVKLIGGEQTIERLQVFCVNVIGCRKCLGMKLDFKSIFIHVLLRLYVTIYTRI